MKNLLGLIFLIVILCNSHNAKAQKATPQKGGFITYGAGIATETPKSIGNINMVFNIENNFAWQLGLGYHASVNDWFAMRFTLTHERTSMSELKFGQPNVIGDRDLQIRERSFVSTRFLLNPVFYFRENLWQFNFSPGVGLALTKNHYTLSYYTEDNSGARTEIVSYDLLDYDKPYFGFAPMISASYQVSKNKKNRSWIELGFQPSWWVNLEKKPNTYLANYNSQMIQLTYMFHFK